MTSKEYWGLDYGAGFGVLYIFTSQVLGYVLPLPCTLLVWAKLTDENIGLGLAWRVLHGGGSSILVRMSSSNIDGVLPY